MRTHLHTGYDSYNTLESELTNRIRKGRFSSVIGGSYNRTDGHRVNMGFEQYGGYAKLGYDVTDNWNLRADVNVTHFKASYPGPVSAPLLEGDQRVTRGMTSFAVENKYERMSGGLSFFYNFGKHWINDGYTPSEGETSQDDRFHSFYDMMGISWSKRTVVEVQPSYGRLGLIPQAGLAFHLSRSIEFKVSASKGFRYPILREIYMFPPQNPDFKPESMWNFEIAFSQRLFEGRLAYGFN